MKSMMRHSSDHLSLRRTELSSWAPCPSLLQVQMYRSEQSMMLWARRKARFYLKRARKASLLAIGIRESKVLSSLLKKFSSFPNLKILKSASSMNRLSQCPLMSNTIGSFSLRLGITAQLSVLSFLRPGVEECSRKMAQMGTSSDKLPCPLKVRQCSIISSKVCTSSSSMRFMQNRFDFDTRISPLRLPSISEGSSRHSCRSSMITLSSGPPSMACSFS